MGWLRVRAGCSVHGEAAESERVAQGGPADPSLAAHEARPLLRQHAAHVRRLGAHVWPGAGAGGSDADVLEIAPADRRWGAQ